MTSAQPHDVEVVINEDEYKPFQKPANLEKARKHGQATKVYLEKPHHENKEEEPEVCACCGRHVEGEPIPVNASLDKLYHLGSGYALYFKFIKYCIGILFLILLVSGIYGLVTNAMSEDCEDDTDEVIYCHRQYIISYTIANKRMHTEELHIQLGLNLAGVILVMFFFQYLRYQLRKTEVEAEDKTTTPADYTICIENINSEATKEEIIEWLEGFKTEEMPVKVVRVIKPYIITKYIELKNQIDEIKQEMDEINKTDSASLSKSDASKLKTLKENLNKTERRFTAVKHQKPVYAPLAYVTFEKSPQSEFIQSKFKKSLIREILGFFTSRMINTKSHFQNKRVKIRRAPEPSDIMWENVGSESIMQDVNRLITNVVTIILILCCFGVVILVNWGQEEVSVSYGKESFVVQGFSIVGSVVIVICNTLLTMTIHYLTGLEKHATYTHFLEGVTSKLVKAQFVNSALLTLFAELVLADTPVAQSQTRLQAINFYGNAGLLESIYWVFISNSLLTPILTIFDFGYFYKLWTRHVLRNRDTANMTQKQAHMLFEGPMMALPAKYATILKMMLMTGFYAPAMPFALVFSIIGLVLCYWADKYTLVRRNAIPKAIDDSLTDSMVETLEWTSLIYSVGNVVYVYTLKDWYGNQAFDEIKANPLIWVTFAVSLFHIFFPMELLNKKLFHIKDEVTEQRSYDEVRLKFPTDYDIENPITRSVSLRDHFKRLKLSKSGAFMKNLKKAEVQTPIANIQDVEGFFLGKKDEQNLLNIRDVQDAPNVAEAEPAEQEFDFQVLDSYAEKVRHVKGTNAQPELDINENLIENLGGENADIGKAFLEKMAAGFETEKGELQPNQEETTPREADTEKGKEGKGGLFGWLQSAPPRKESRAGGEEQNKGIEEAGWSEEREVLSGRIESKYEFQGENHIIHMASVNDVAPQFNRDQDDDKGSKQGNNSGNGNREGSAESQPISLMSLGGAFASS